MLGLSLLSREEFNAVNVGGIVPRGKMSGFKMNRKKNSKIIY